MSTSTADFPVLAGLRAARAHLEAQVEAGLDTRHGTLEEAAAALVNVNTRIDEVEARLRNVPEAAYLFRKKFPKFSKSTGRTRVRPTQSQEESTSPATGEKEATMASKSKKAQLEETLIALRRAEKSAGTTKWALDGAGAKKNPPDAKKKKHLKEKLAGEQARIAELRAQRDELKASA